MEFKLFGQELTTEDFGYGNDVENGMDVADVIDGDEVSKEMDEIATEAYAVSAQMAFGAEVHENLVAQASFGEKLASQPEQLSSSVVALATESFKSTAGLIGLTESDLGHVSDLTVESIEASPVTSMELTTEAMKDTAKKIVEQIKGLWAKLVNGAKKLVMKAVVAFNNVGKVANKLESKIGKLTGEPKELSKDDGKKLVSKLAAATITMGENKLTPGVIENLMEDLSGTKIVKLAEKFQEELFNQKNINDLVAKIDTGDVKSVQDKVNSMYDTYKKIEEESKLVAVGSKKIIEEFIKSDAYSAYIITRFDGTKISGIKVTLNSSGITGNIEKVVKLYKESDDSQEGKRKAMGVVFKLLKDTISFGTFSFQIPENKYANIEVKVFSIDELKSTSAKVTQAAVSLKGNMQSFENLLKGLNKGMDEFIKRAEKEREYEAGVYLRKISTAANYGVTKLYIDGVYNYLYNVKNSLSVLNEMSKLYSTDKSK